MNAFACPLCKGIEAARDSQDPEDPLRGLFPADFLVSSFFLGLTVERFVRAKDMNVADVLCEAHLARIRELGDEVKAKGLVSPSNVHLLATGPHLRSVKE